MYSWLIAVLLFGSTLGWSAWKVSPEPNDYHLNRVLSKFFKDKHNLRVFDFGQTPLILSEYAVWSHSQKDLTVLNDMGYGASNPCTNIGYVVKSNFEFLSIGLEAFAKINTNGRWLLLTADAVENHQASGFLTHAWSTYNMLNILLVHRTVAQFYDPFTPEIVQLDISSDLVDFTRFEARTKNARGYLLQTEALSRQKGYAYEENFHIYDNLLDYVMRYINARPEEVLSLPVISQISAISNQGQYVGAHKRINESAIELSMVLQAVLDLGKSNVAYIYPTQMIKYFYMVKNRPGKIKIIDLRVWDKRSETVELISLSLILILWFLLEQCRFENLRHRHGVTRVLADVVSILWGSSIQLFHRDQTSIRIIVWVLLFYSLILNSTYQGQIITKLSTPWDIENIKNLKELLATNYSLFSAFSSWQFKDSCSLTLQQLANRNVHVSDLHYISQTFDNRSDVAFLATQNLIKYCKATIYDQETGDQFNHKISTDVVDFLGSFLVRRDSAFLVELNRALIQAFETGFHVFANKQFEQKLFLLKSKRKLRRIKAYGGKGKPKPIRIVNLKLIFEWYFIMLGSAFGVFLTEIIWFWVMNKLRKIARFQKVISVLEKIGNIL